MTYTCYFDLKKIVKTHRPLLSAFHVPGAELIFMLIISFKSILTLLVAQRSHD